MSQQAADHDIFPWDSKNWVLDSENSGDKRAPDLDLNVLTEAENLPAQKRLRNGSIKGKEVVHENDDIPAAGNPDHDLHIWTERERRKKMGNMFATLHALIPQLPTKADKSTILEAAISTIKKLEATLERLQKKKMEKIRGTVLHSPLPRKAQFRQATGEFSREALMADQVKNLPLAASSRIRFQQGFHTWSSPNVVVSVSGADAHINICAVTKRGLMSSIVRSLEKHNLHVLSANVSCDFFRSMFMIHAQANGTPDSFPMETPLEEIFKSAVGEIMTWIS